MSDRLVEVANFSTSGEANIAKAALEAQGIRACIDGEATAGAMWHAGPAIAGVRVSVFADQLAKAKHILAEAGYGFDDEDDEEYDEDEEYDSDDADQDEDDDPVEAERQAHLRRAWFAAVIGIVTCPLVFNAYSLYLLVAEGLLDSAKGVRGDWRITAALVLDILALGLIALYLTSGYWGPVFQPF